MRFTQSLLKFVEFVRNLLKFVVFLVIFARLGSPKALWWLEKVSNLLNTVLDSNWCCQLPWFCLENIVFGLIKSYCAANSMICASNMFIKNFHINKSRSLIIIHYFPINRASPVRQHIQSILC